MHRARGSRLWPIDNLCLAVIGIAAGCELHLVELRRKEFRATVLSLTAAVTATTWAFVFPAVLLLGPHIGFLRGATRGRLLSVASLAATLGVARSPASMIAVLREMDARGPFCSLVMSVTVVKDVLVLLLFSVNVELVYAVEAAAAEGKLGLPALLTRCLATPALKLAVSAVLGAVGGVLLGALLVQPRVGDRGALPAAVLLLAAIMFLGARALPAEPLLVCVSAGALAANRREERGERQREELHSLVGQLMPWVNLTFFTLAGAALAVDALAATAPVAAVIHAVRLLSLVAATAADAFGLPRELRRVTWMAMVTQAGVALGLARTVLARFPAWGGDFYALMVATIVLNQAVGPPLFRAAIVAVGEHHKQRSAAQSPGGSLPSSPAVSLAMPPNLASSDGHDG